MTVWAIRYSISGMGLEDYRSQGFVEGSGVFSTKELAEKAMRYIFDSHVAYLQKRYETQEQAIKSCSLWPVSEHFNMPNIEIREDALILEDGRRYYTLRVVPIEIDGYLRYMEDKEDGKER